jgi:hypothetical protein
MPRFRHVLLSQAFSASAFANAPHPGFLQTFLRVEQLECRDLPSSTPAQFELGQVPIRFNANGADLSFRVTAPDDAVKPITMDLVGFTRPLGTITFKGGLFTYRYDPRDVLPFDIRLNSGDTGNAWQSLTQIVTLFPLVPATETRFVAVAKPLPDRGSPAYLTVSQTVRPQSAGTHFNGAPHTTLRDVHVTGSEVRIGPGEDNGIYEQINYSDPAGLSATNANLARFEVEAQTIIISAPLRLAGTQVTFTAERVVFKDTPGTTAALDTSALDYQQRAVQFADGRTGQDGGAITLIVRAIDTPAGSSAVRFISRGGRGQAAGEGAKGANGNSRLTYEGGITQGNVWVYREMVPQFAFGGSSPVAASNGLPVRFMIIDGGGNYSTDRTPEGKLVVTAQIVGRTQQTLVSYSPARVDEPNFTLTLRKGINTHTVQFSPSSRVNLVGPYFSSVWGEDTFPTDGGPARPGGTPGGGGAGGRVVVRSNGVSAEAMARLVDLPGGAPGAPASNQDGGDPGQPVFAEWSNQHVTTRRRTTLAGPGWTAVIGAAGASAAVTIEAPVAAHWITSDAARAHVEFLADAELNGQAAFVAGELADLAAALDSKLAATVIPELAELRQKVTVMAQRSAAGQDAFGNPAGYAPSLSAAASLEAYSNQIDTSLRMRYLGRFLTKTTTDRDAAAATMQRLLAQIDVRVADATATFNDGEAQMPGLQAQIADIESQTEIANQQLARLEAQLRERAEKNVNERNKVPGWKRAISVMAQIAKVIPHPAAVVGGTFAEYLLAPAGTQTALGFDDLAKLFRDTPNDLPAKITAIKTAFKEFKLPSKLSAAELQAFTKRIEPLTSAVDSLAKAVQTGLKEASVPAGAVEVELAKLKAEDPAFAAAVAALERLHEQKFQFVATLMSVLQGTLDAAGRIVADYASADTLNAELGAAGPGLSHAAQTRLKSLDASARDLLLRAQYLFVKAFEAETLTPWQGDYQTRRVDEEIVRLLDNGTTETYLDNPENFAALKALYEDDLQSALAPTWAKLNSEAPGRTSILQIHLNAAQLEALNRDGVLPMNVVRDGFLSAGLPNARILEVGVTSVSAVASVASPQVANIRLEIEAAGESIVQNGGFEYLVRNRRSPEDRPITWAADYDLPSGRLSPSQISPTALANVAALLKLNPASLSDDQAARLWSHIGADTDLIVRRRNSLVPTGAITLREVTLFVRFDADRPPANVAVVSVQASAGLQPVVALDAPDLSGHRVGTGDFRRYVPVGRTVVLTAEPNFGRHTFLKWTDAAETVLGTSPVLELTATQDMLVRAIYDADPPPVANTPPDAKNDSTTTVFQTAKSIAVLGNDSDANGDVLSITGTTTPANGTIAIDGDEITYTPNAGFTGVDTFNYTIVDGKGGTDTATVTVNISAATPSRHLVGYSQLAVGADAGSANLSLYNFDGSVRFTLDPFPEFTGGVRTAAADFNGDGIADIVAGTGPGRATRVTIFDGANQKQLFAVDPFEATFAGGVYVAAGDVNGDGIPDLAITPDEGGGPRVDIYSGDGFAKIASFFGIDDTNFRGGARASIADFTDDGVGDLIVVAGFGGGPRVAAFEGRSLSNVPQKIFGDFFAFEQTLRNGIFVTSGDINGDGYADLIAGGGPGGGPRVLAFDGKSLINNQYVNLANFFGGDPNSRGGIRLAMKDLDGDIQADLVVGAGSGAGSRVTAYLGKNIATAGTPPSSLDFDSFTDFPGGVFVG